MTEQPTSEQKLMGFKVTYMTPEETDRYKDGICEREDQTIFWRLSNDNQS